MTRPTSGNKRAKAMMYRQSDKGRLARKMYNLQPNVRAYKKIRRAIKHHLTPPPIGPAH